MDCSPAPLRSSTSPPGRCVITSRPMSEPEVPWISMPVPACATVNAACSCASTPLSSRSTAITPSATPLRDSGPCCSSATASTGSAPRMKRSASTSCTPMSRITPPASGRSSRQPCTEGGSSMAWKTRANSGWPTAPSRTSSRILRCVAALRRWWLVPSTTPAARHALTMSSACSTVSANGFSHRTCLPAAAAARTWAWRSSLSELT